MITKKAKIPTQTEALESAYNKISKRTGETINGTFVKTEDLTK